MKIKAKLNMPNYKELAKLTGLNKHGEVQKYIDNFVLTESDDYTPGNHINDSGRNSTQIGSGKVVWGANDANYLYEGKMMVDSKYKVGAFPIRDGKIDFNKKHGPIDKFVSRKGEPKIPDPKGRDLHYRGGVKKDHWFDKMIDDKMDDLLDGVQHIINKR